jgi:hypothetical protein
LKLLSNAGIPLMIAVITVVITIQQQKVAQQNRDKDLVIVGEQREQDLHLARIQREEDQNADLR